MTARAPSVRETVEAFYTVQQMADELGMTDGRIYQLIKRGIEEGYPPDGLWVRPASEEALIRMGRNPRLIRKPKWWIPESEVERFRKRDRRTYLDLPA